MVPDAPCRSITTIGDQDKNTTNPFLNGLLMVDERTISYTTIIITYNENIDLGTSSGLCDKLLS
jgi:hypothetical protein